MKKQYMKFNKWIEQKKFTNFLIAVLSAVIIVTGSYLFFLPQLQALASVLGIHSEQRENSVVVDSLPSTPTPIPTENPTPIPTYAPTQTPKVKPVYIDPDPIVSCSISSNCGGGTRQMKKSECTQSTCCQLGSTWSVYPSNIACDQAQSNYNSSKTSGTNYPPCTVYYPALHTSSTYSYTSPETCKQWQDTANAGSTNTIQQPTPAPTQDNSEYNALLKKHQEACIQAAAEWVGVREQWEEANGNNYSSSAEMVMALRQRMAQYQQELYSVGCTQTISLY